MSRSGRSTINHAEAASIVTAQFSGTMDLNQLLEIIDDEVLRGAP